jgi:hypothetical protein
MRALRQASLYRLLLIRWPTFWLIAWQKRSAP